MIGDIDPGVLWELAMSRHADHLRQAAADRAVRRPHPRRPGLHDRLTLVVADRLIVLGLRLKRHCDDHTAPAQRYGHSHIEWSVVSGQWSGVSICHTSGGLEHRFQQSWTRTPD